MPLALGRFLPREWRPHGVLFLSALFAAVTPFIAGLASAYAAPNLPSPLAAVARGAGGGGRAGRPVGRDLSGDAVARGPVPRDAVTAVMVFNDWRTGAEKGAVYGLVFMALLLAAQLVLSFGPAAGLISASGPIGATLIGALAYPLVRTIVESTDSTPSFFSRLEREYARSSNYARGFVAGAAVGLALTSRLRGGGGLRPVPLRPRGGGAGLRRGRRGD